MLKYFSDQIMDFFSMKSEQEDTRYVKELITSHTVIPSACTKCGATDVITFYHKTSVDPRYPMCGEEYHNSDYLEHLHYMCNNCGYDWTGPTLDKKETPNVNV